MKFSILAAATASLFNVVSADFQIFYVLTSPLVKRGSTLAARQGDAGTQFNFFNNPPDCSDFDNSKYGEGLIVEADDPSDGMVCRAANDESCFPMEREDIDYLSWNDDTDDLNQMTSCAIGPDTRISNNGDGTWNLVGADGTVHGTCTKPTEPQDVNCGGLTGYQGHTLFTCSSECTAMNTAN